MCLLSYKIVDKIDSVKDALGKFGKKAVEATKKAEDLAGNMWQHCKSFSNCFNFKRCFFANYQCEHTFNFTEF